MEETTNAGRVCVSVCVCARAFSLASDVECVSVYPCVLSSYLLWCVSFARQFPPLWVFSQSTEAIPFSCCQKTGGK